MTQAPPSDLADGALAAGAAMLPEGPFEKVLAFDATAADALRGDYAVLRAPNGDRLLLHRSLIATLAGEFARRGYTPLGPAHDAVGRLPRPA